MKTQGISAYKALTLLACLSSEINVIKQITQLKFHPHESFLYLFSIQIKKKYAFPTYCSADIHIFLYMFLLLNLSCEMFIRSLRFLAEACCS